jgi:hypothetical protein
MTTQGSTDGWVRAYRLAALGEDEPCTWDTGRCPVRLLRTGGRLAPAGSMVRT